MSNNPNMINPLSLAFVGDAVYTLEVRRRLTLDSLRHVNDLHKESVKYVNAASQSQAVKKLLPVLTEEEESIFKRGRNAHAGHTPKNQSEGDYHYATGLEALFGYLYLSGENERIKELFDTIWSESNG
ncbi:MAG: ribonuclease III [Ruminococcaceae bacterium]|jgi:ribonuclease-3 family protein|nr:ribonuclease III [Oscillospiraceae bacterium]